MLRYHHLQDILLSNKNFTDRGITFIHDSEHETFVSYNQVYQRSLSLLYGLQKVGIEAGQELLFQIDDNQIFIETFWAGIMGEMIPVPVSVGSNDESRLKVFNVWKKLNQPYMICSDKVLDGLNDFTNKHEDLQPIFQEMKQYSVDPAQLMDMYIGHQAELQDRPDLNPIAFIQFSSGSTGDPKGVVLSHSNLLSNISAIADRWSIEFPGSTLSWIPLTHDMGLISMHILSTFTQIDQYIMPTKLFIRDPLLWMEKAHQHHVGGLFCPNFGYKYFLAFYQPDKDYKWDLSGINFISNGAEPISTELCETFMKEMSRYNIRTTAMKAVYGLAEGTVGVCVSPREEVFKYVSVDHRSLNVGNKVKYLQQSEPNSMKYADVGYPLDSCEIKIIDGDGKDLGENTVGFIHIKGPSVTQGYYNDEEATNKALRSDGWLNTGDIGFLNRDRLIVIGREKDVIIVNGQNVYAHDIERVAEEIEGIELWNIAACGVRKPSMNSDEVILFLLYRSKDLYVFSTLAEKAIQRIQNTMGITVDHVIPVRSIPKTTSGKVQRHMLANAYKNGEFDSVVQELGLLKAAHSVKPQTTKEILDKVFYDILGEKLELDDTFIDIGGNSLILTRIGDELQKTYGIEITVADLYNYPTLSQLISFIDRRGKIKLPSIGLPGHYFTSSGRINSGFEAMLQHGICNGLREIAKSADVEVGTVLISMFLYLLREVSDEHEVSIQTIDDSNGIRTICIDFDSIVTVNALFEEVHSRMKDPNEAPLQLCDQDFERIVPAGDHRILPLLSTSSLASKSHRLNQTFDVVLEIAENVEQMELCFFYNHRRLSNHYLKILFGQYITLLSDLVGISDQASV